MKTAQGIRSQLLGIASTLILVGCVHTKVQRLSRARLDNGKDSVVQVFETAPLGVEPAAQLNVKPEFLATKDRSIKHLRRSASLLGCSALIDVRVENNGEARGTCAVGSPLMIADSLDSQQRESEKSPVANDEAQVFSELLQMLTIRSQSEQVWAIRWYLQGHPASAHREQLQALLQEKATFTAGAQRSTIATAPSVR